nr:Clp protease N-terminal domain-containing protein [Streptomyces sp. HPF1205]
MPDPNHLADDPRLTVEVRAVAADARRRATRDGDRQVDTAHLLHSLLERDPAAREACDAGTGRIARVLGYLVQRSIGYGLRWSGSVEDSGSLPAVTGAAPGWSPAAAAAVRAAMAGARRHGRARADGIDLLHALAADPKCRAVEVLRAAGIEPAPGGPGDVSRYRG